MNTNEVLTALKDVGLVAISILALLLSQRSTSKAFRQKHDEDEKKEIYKKLNSFYGPLVQLREISFELYKRLKEGQDDNFRTLIALLRGDKFEGNDLIILQQILDISKKIDELIINNSGLVDNDDFRNTLGKVGTHIRLIELAFNGSLVGQEERFKDNIFPSDFDAKIKVEINKLKDRLSILNKI